MIILRGKLRRFVARSWALSWCYYRLHGLALAGRPGEHVWYFAYGANMHDRVGPRAGPRQPTYGPTRRPKFGEFSTRSHGAICSASIRPKEFPDAATGPNGSRPRIATGGFSLPSPISPTAVKRTATRRCAT